MRQTEEIKIGKYANVLMDRWFKRSFGTERGKRLLQLFLQEVIPERTIVELQFEPQEHVNPEVMNKDVRIDVECIDQDGARFVVEVQVSPQEGFYERAIYNASFAIQEQMRRGESSYDFPPVYFIGIMNFSFHQGSDQVLYRYTVREVENDELMSDRIQYLFLELPNCRKAMTPEASLLDNFCYTLRNMPTWEERPAGLDTEIFNLLFDSVEIANFAPGERKKYIYDMTTKRDIQNQIAYARKEGLEKGLEKGKTETILSFIMAGATDEMVATATGMSLEEIAALRPTL